MSSLQDLSLIHGNDTFRSNWRTPDPLLAPHMNKIELKKGSFNPIFTLL